MNEGEVKRNYHKKCITENNKKIALNMSRRRNFELLLRNRNCQLELDMMSDVLIYIKRL